MGEAKKKVDMSKKDNSIKTQVITNSPFSSTWSNRDAMALRDSVYDVYIFDGFKQSLFRGAVGAFRLLWKNRRKKAIWIHQSAGHGSLIPCVFGKCVGHRNIVFAIGTDTACFPEIQYGHYRKWSTRLSAKISFKRADLICPLHESLMGYDYTYWDVKHKRQGIKAFIPDLKTPYFPIENGYDRLKWGVDKAWKDRAVDVMCVFALGTKNRSVLKGADLILQVAKRNPRLKFRIIGSSPPGLDVPKNCQIEENCNQTELRGHYNESKIFIQASISEGFGNTLCEAMACGCFPIGSDTSSIPSIISNHGLILKKRDDVLLESLIVTALERIESTQTTPEAISNSIFDRYSMEQRRMKLLSALARFSEDPNKHEQRNH